MRTLIFGLWFASLVMPVASARQVTTRESVRKNGNQARGDSIHADISPDGRFVTFCSEAKNLVNNDNDGVMDCFLRDRTTGKIALVSIDSSGGQADRECWDPVVNGDGTVVAFWGPVNNLVAGDNNGVEDIFVHDLVSGATSRASVDSSGVEADDWSCCPQISDDGKIVVFLSFATNLVSNDSNGQADIFVHDVSTGITTRVSVDAIGNEADSASGIPHLSSDGRFVVFCSVADNLVPNDLNGTTDTFLHDRQTGGIELISVDSSGNQGDAESRDGVVSADGRYVVFKSLAGNLVAGVSSGKYQLFLRDRVAGTTTLVSASTSGVAGNESVGLGFSLSDDGRYCAFESDSDNLVSGDTNRLADVFRKDLTTQELLQLSVDDAGVEGEYDSLRPAISGDGRFTVFESYSSNLVPNDTNREFDIFLRDLCPPASWFNYGDGWPGTLGVPTMTASANPSFGADVTIGITNSLSVPTPALLLVGLGETNQSTNRGGALLVAPLFWIPLMLEAGTTSLDGTMSKNRDLCGVEIDLQTVEVDAGASNGFSFTDGLALVLGS